MKNLRRIASLLLMAVMVAGLLAVSGGNVQATKKKKVELNKKTVTLEVDKKGTLDLSGLTALTGLDCYSNQLSSLDVSGATALTYLECDNSVQLTGWPK